LNGSSGRPRKEAAPASSGGCGYVSVFDVAPRAQNIHGVKLLSIDGHAAGPEGRTNFRLDAGHHELEIAEEIERPYLSFGSRQRAVGRSTKTFGVDVSANITYYLGAQLHVEKRNDYKDGAYWDPIIWKQADTECR
jgi:hypothetical protein